MTDSGLLIVGMLLSLALLMETFGAYMRAVGAYFDKPALGYSSHVRVATLGRFFILISSPIIGYFTDVYQDAKIIFFIGIVAFLSYLILSLIMFFLIGIKSYIKVFSMLNGGANPVKTENFNITLKFKINKLYVASFIAFIITSTGIIVVNSLASIFSEYRATIVQMSAIVTTFGTLVHIFLVDPILSKASDTNFEESFDSIQQHVSARIAASFSILIIFSAVYINS